MSVGSSNLTGIPTRVAPPPVKQVQANNQQSTQVSQSARQAALSSANSPTNPLASVAVSTAVSALGSPAISGVGGTTTPSGNRPVAQAGSVPQANAQQQSQAMSAFAPFLALAGAAALGATRTRVSRVSGDEKEDTGDVEVETESELQPDALQESNQEQGAGEITQAGSTSGPST